MSEYLRIEYECLVHVPSACHRHDEYFEIRGGIPMLTLPEQMMLFILNERSGAVTSSSHAVNYGLAGAVLMELALLERLEVEQRQIQILNSSSTEDPLLDTALTIIAQERRPRNARWWVGRLPSRMRPLREQVLQRLHAKGILRIESGRALGLFRYNRYWITDREPKAALWSAMRAALFDGQTPDARVLLLMDLLQSCKLFERLFPAKERRTVRRQLRSLVESETVPKAVSQAVRDVETAVMAAIVASTVVSTSSSNS